MSLLQGYIFLLPNIIQVNESRMRWVEHIERMEEMRKEYNNLVRKLKEMRILGRITREQEGKVQIYNVTIYGRD
jgi:hypothetical protein